MARLYVLNPTNQHRRVYYRLDYSLDGNGNKIDGARNYPVFQDIAAGSQVEFGKDWHPVQIGEIIQQLEFGAGATSVQDINGAKRKGQINLVWQQDIPIPRALCENVMLHNQGALRDAGENRRKNAAIASEYALREIREEEGMSGNTNLRMEFEMASDGEDGVSKLEEGFTVQDAPRPRGRPRKDA